MLKIFGKKRIIKICTKACVKYSCNDYEDWNSIFDGDGMKVNMTSKTIMGKPTYVQFEDTMLPVPEKTHEYLTNIYGNYMKIPSKKQIKEKEHTQYFLDLNLPYKEYKKKEGKRGNIHEEK